MRRAALAAAFLGLLGTGIGCRAVFGRCDCLNDPSCQPLPAYQNPSPVVGPTMAGASVGPAIGVPPVGAQPIAPLPVGPGAGGPSPVAPPPIPLSDVPMKGIEPAKDPMK